MVLRDSSPNRPSFFVTASKRLPVGSVRAGVRYGKTVGLQLKFPKNFSLESSPETIWIWTHPGQLWILSLLVDALRSTFSTDVPIHVVLSYADYSRWVESESDGAGLSGRVYAQLLSSLSVNDWVLFDVHHSQLLHYFSSPVRVISIFPFWAKYIRLLGDIDLLVAPDCGRAESVKTLAQELSLDFIVIDKYSKEPLSQTSAKRIRGKNVFVFDDEIRSGNTLQLAAKLLTDSGVQKIHFGVLYPLCESKILERLSKQKNVESVTISDVIPFPQIPEVRELALVNPVLKKLLSD